MSGGKIRIASLFSGCGGLDLGALGGFSFMDKKFASNNTKIVFANDIDPDAATCYNNNIHKTTVKSSMGGCRLGDIREIPLEEIPMFDVLLAGFPCQPFSNAGNRKGVHDVGGRGTLFEMCESVLKAKIDEAKIKHIDGPIAFIFENVRGILSSKMPSGITVPDEIRNRMEALGFSVSINLVCASEYGVPQERYRVIISGIRKDVCPAFNLAEKMVEVVKKYKLPSKVHGGKEKLLLGNLLNELPDDCERASWGYSATTQRMVNLIGPCSAGKEDLVLFRGNFSLEKLPDRVFEGRSWKNIHPDLLTPRFRKIYDNPKKYHAPKFFRRFALGEINGTITASAQPENCGITHPFENRRFSVREIARIQSFPDSYTFNVVPLQSQYKVIGNAVPPVLGWVMIRAMLSLIKGE